MRRLAAAFLSAAGILIWGPSLLGLGLPPALGHAQLVSSIPGAGQHLDEPPTELILVFSERLDRLGTSADVLDAAGATVVLAGGEVDANDPRAFVVPVSALADGLYTVAWRSLSSDDGHTAQGFFTFGVGPGALPTDGGHSGHGTGQQTGGDVHAGHDLGRVILETAARFAMQLGSMLALGLSLVAAAVIRPLDRNAASIVGGWSAIGLAAAGLGAVLMVPLAAGSARVDPIAYVAGTGPGELLAARAVVGLALAVITWILVQRGGRWLPVAAIGGGQMIVLLAASGHSAAFGSVAPVLAASIHVAAAGTWLAGLIVLGWLGYADDAARRPLIRPAVPRFSALAVVSVGLFTLTGVYMWWLMSRQLLDLETDYGTLLALKVVLVLGALGLGALNYLGWRQDGRLAMHRRIPIEGAVVLAVVGVTALLVSGSPPGPTKPIPISQATSSSATRLDASLYLLPARPGANQVRVRLAEPAPPSSLLELDLQRLDQTGDTRAALLSIGEPADASYATDVLLPANSRWDANVVLIVGGTEGGRARFEFAFDGAGLVLGQARPPIDPLAAVALLLGGLAIVALTLALAGGLIPRTESGTSRGALIAGAATAIAFAAVALAVGPRI